MWRNNQKAPIRPHEKGESPSLLTVPLGSIQDDVMLCQTTLILRLVLVDRIKARP